MTGGGYRLFATGYVQKTAKSKALMPFGVFGRRSTKGEDDA
jgi:hypothetical protein